MNWVYVGMTVCVCQMCVFVFQHKQKPSVNCIKVILEKDC